MCRRLKARSLHFRVGHEEQHVAYQPVHKVHPVGHGAGHQVGHEEQHLVLSLGQAFGDGEVVEQRRHQCFPDVGSDRAGRSQPHVPIRLQEESQCQDVV